MLYLFNKSELCFELLIVDDVDVVVAGDVADHFVDSRAFCESGNAVIADFELFLVLFVQIVEYI